MANSKSSSVKVQVGICLSAMLMSGAIGVSSSIGVLMEHYQITQVMALNVVSVPCFAIIIVSLISGWLMSIMAKKTINIIGIVLFTIGGMAPLFVDTWAAVIASRVIFGIGLGMVQSTTAALVAENFEGAEKDLVMGRQQAFQMVGLIVFSLIGGQLGASADGAHLVFAVHALGVICLIAVLVLIPHHKPQKAASDADAPKESLKINGGIILWTAVSVLFFMGGQVYSNVINILLGELGLGGSGEAGISLGIFAVGGVLAGFLFGKIFGILRNMTLPVGLFALAISYVLMAFSGNIIGIYAGSLLCGLSFSVVVPCIMTSTSNVAVNAASAAFAISLATCGQSVGQSISSYVITPLGQAMSAVSGFSVNQMSLTVTIIIVAVFAIIFVPWGIKQNRK